MRHAARGVGRLAALVGVALALVACGDSGRATAATTTPATTQPATTQPATTTTALSPGMIWYKTYAKPAVLRIDNAVTQVDANLSAAGGSELASTACQPLTQAVAGADNVPPAPDATINGKWQTLLADYTQVSADCLMGSINKMLTAMNTAFNDSVVLGVAIFRTRG